WDSHIAPLLGYAAPPEDWPGVTLPPTASGISPSPVAPAPAEFQRVPANRAERLLTVDPGIVLVPDEGQAPFGIDRLVSSQIGSDANGVSYTLSYTNGASTAALRGEPGPVPSQGGPPPCSGAYCTYPGLDGKTPAAESFGGLQVKGVIAVVFHAACCAGDSWQVFWYDKAANRHYTLTLDGDFDSQVGQV